MKKFTATILALCMATGIFTTTASAASLNDSWTNLISKWYEYFFQVPETETTEETELPIETEPPVESEPAEEYTIRYDANGGYFYYQYASPTISDSKSYKVTAGETHTIISGPQRTSYTFKGWKASDGTIYQKGDKIIPTESMTFTAVWSYNGS